MTNDFYIPYLYFGILGFVLTITIYVGAWLCDVVASRAAAVFARKELDKELTHRSLIMTSTTVRELLAKDIRRALSARSTSDDSMDKLRMHLISAYLVRPDIDLNSKDFVRILRDADPRIRKLLFETTNDDLKMQLRREIKDLHIRFLVRIIDEWKLRERYVQNFKELKELVKIA
jgi:hypothetical protein